MAEPISITASAAAIVGLTDVICRAGTTLHAFFAAVKDAPQDIQRMVAELKRLDNILKQVKAYAGQLQSSSPLAETLDTLRDILESCRDECAQLQEVIDVVNRNRGQGPWKKIAKQIEWVSKNRRVSRSCHQLERHRQGLELALQVIGGHNDTVIRERIELTHQDLKHQTTALASKVDIGFQNLTATTTSASQSHDEQLQGFHGLLSEGIDHVKAGNTRLSSRLDAVGQSSADMHQTTLTRLATSSARNDKDFGSIRKELAHSRHDQRAYSQRLLQSSSDMKSKLDQVSKGVESIVIGHHGQAKYDGLNLQDITFPLMLLKPMLFETLSRSTLKGDINISNEEAFSLESEFNDLLASSQEATARSLRKKHLDHSNRAPFSTGEQSSRDRLRPSHCASVSTWKRKRDNEEDVVVYEPPSKQIRRWQSRKSWMVQTRDGCLTVQFGSPSDPSITDLQDSTCKFGIQFSFQPHPSKQCKLGIEATYLRFLGSQMEPRMLRHISTYALVPRDSLAFTYIKTSDVDGLRFLFANGLASPTDREEDGTPLLWTAAYNVDLQMCRFLLQQGADPLDCNKHGGNALYAVEKGVWENAVYQEHAIDICRLLLANGCDFEERDLSGKNKTCFLDCHIWVPTASIELPGLDKLVTGFVKLGCDLEERNGRNDTALLSCARQADKTPTNQLIALLNQGADVRALDAEGRDALCLSLEATHRYLHIRYRDQLDLMTLKKVWTRLLKAGCRPNVDHGIWTLSTVALCPVIWPLWCRALEDAGYSISTVLKRDFEIDKILWERRGGGCRQAYKIPVQYLQDWRAFDMFSKTPHGWPPFDEVIDSPHDDRLLRRLKINALQDYNFSVSLWPLFDEAHKRATRDGKHALWKGLLNSIPPRYNDTHYICEHCNASFRGYFKDLFDAFPDLVRCSSEKSRRSVEDGDEERPWVLLLPYQVNCEHEDESDSEWESSSEIDCGHRIHHEDNSDSGDEDEDEVKDKDEHGNEDEPKIQGKGEPPAEQVVDTANSNARHETTAEDEHPCTDDSGPDDLDSILDCYLKEKLDIITASIITLRKPLSHPAPSM